MQIFPTNCTKRIYGELVMINKCSSPGLIIKLEWPEDMTKLDLTFSGCSNSPYEKGMYDIHFQMPHEYPRKPPKAYFSTKIWHPNISSVTGCVCHSILSSEWSRNENLLNVITGIHSLLANAEPDDPQDAQVAAQYKNNHDLFIKTAAFWNYFYAGGVKQEGFLEFENKIQQLQNRGYTKDKSIHMLSMKNWDVDEALKYL